MPSNYDQNIFQYLQVREKVASFLIINSDKNDNGISSFCIEPLASFNKAYEMLKINDLVVKTQEQLTYFEELATGISAIISYHQRYDYGKNIFETKNFISIDMLLDETVKFINKIWSAIKLVKLFKRLEYYQIYDAHYEELRSDCPNEKLVEETCLKFNITLKNFKVIKESMPIFLAEIAKFEQELDNKNSSLSSNNKNLLVKNVTNKCLRINKFAAIY